MCIDRMRALMLATLLLAPLPGAAHNDITLWEQGLELFFEPPPLVSGAAARLVVHLTTLEDQQPLAPGRLELVLQPRGGSALRVLSPAPVSPGIHVLDITPAVAGMHSMAFNVETPDGMRTLEIRRIVVLSPEVAERLHAEEAEAEADHEHEGEIIFSKEAQWRMHFAVAPSHEGPFADRLTLPAVVEPVPGRVVDIVAPAPGALRPAADRAWLRAGQRVAAGEVLAELVPVAGIEDLIRLRADFEAADARARLAQAELARVRGLVDDGALPERRLIEAETEAVAARGARDTLRDRLAVVHGDAVETEGLPLTVPLDGTVIESQVTPGQVVDAGARIATILDASRVWVRVQVPAPDIAALVEPQDLRIRRPGSRAWDAPAASTLVYRGQVIEHGGLPLVFEIDNAGAFPIGLPLIAALASGDPHTRITVPEVAVLDDEGIDVVIVQVGGEMFERRAVRLGTRAAGRIAVLDGVAAGERVVVDGAYAVLLAGRDPGGLDHGHTH